MNFLVAGGSGFVGKRIIMEALKKGHRVTYLSRHEGKGELFMLPELTYVYGDLLEEDSIDLLDNHFDVLIDCVGAIKPKMLQLLNVQATQGAISLCQRYQIPKIVYLSAAGGYPAYLKSKGKAEISIQTSGLQYIILRPGLIFHSSRLSSMIQAKMIKGLSYLPGFRQLLRHVYPINAKVIAKYLIGNLENGYSNIILSADQLRENKKASFFK